MWVTSYQYDHPFSLFLFSMDSKSLDKAGANMEVAKYTERLVPSTRFVAVDGVAPMVAEYGTFVAPSASVIGDVTIGRNSRYVCEVWIDNRQQHSYAFD